MEIEMKRIIIRALTGLIFIVGQPAFAAIAPIYQVVGNDATWTHMGGGEYTVLTSAEDYANEIWERPVSDGKWTDSSGTRRTTSGAEYWAYGDLKSGAWGVDSEYLYMKWEVVGDYKHIYGENNPVTEELKGHYYFYAEPAGKNAFAVEVPSGKDLGANFGDVTGKVNIYNESNDHVPGSDDITVTGEGGDSFGNVQVKGEGRTNTSTFVTEVAVLLSDLGLSKSDFVDHALDWAYLGVAVSNPSSPATDLFANDHFAEAQGFGQEYDTIRMGTVVPIPAAVWLFGSGLLGLFGFSRRKKPARL